MPPLYLLLWLLVFLTCGSHSLPTAPGSGWSQHLWQGKPYWHNEATGQSTWEDPMSLIQQQQQQQQQQKAHHRPMRGARGAPLQQGQHNTSSRALHTNHLTSAPVPATATATATSTYTTPTSPTTTTAAAAAQASPSIKKSVVVSALKVADQRLDELQTAFDAAERDKLALAEALAAERRAAREAEDGRAAAAEELAQALREAEDDYTDLQAQLGGEKQARALLEGKMKAVMKDKERALASVARAAEELQTEKRRADRLPSQMLLRFFGGLVGVSGSGSGGASGSAGRRTGSAARSKKDPSGVGSAISSKQLNRTLALMRENMTALLDSAASKDEIIRDLAQQISEYQEESERRKKSYEEIRRRIGGVLEERDRLIDAVEALSLNTCDMAVKISILQQYSARAAAHVRELEEARGARAVEAPAAEGGEGKPAEAAYYHSPALPTAATVEVAAAVEEAVEAAEAYMGACASASLPSEPGVPESGVPEPEVTEPDAASSHDAPEVLNLDDPSPNPYPNPNMDDPDPASILDGGPSAAPAAINPNPNPNPSAPPAAMPPAPDKTDDPL